MQPAGTETLNSEEKVVHEQLTQAVEKINAANEVLSKHPGAEAAAGEAVALALIAIARVMVVSKAADWNMVSRLPVFK